MINLEGRIILRRGNAVRYLDPKSGLIPGLKAEGWEADRPKGEAKPAKAIEETPAL